MRRFRTIESASPLSFRLFCFPQAPEDRHACTLRGDRQRPVPPPIDACASRLQLCEKPGMHGSEISGPILNRQDPALLQ